MVNVTKEFKKQIKDSQIRKNVTKIIKEYDGDFERTVYHIYFKKNTVSNIYEDEYMESTDAMENNLHTGADAINEWLKEIAYVKKGDKV